MRRPPDPAILFHESLGSGFSKLPSDPDLAGITATCVFDWAAAAIYCRDGRARRRKLGIGQTAYFRVEGRPNPLSRLGNHPKFYFLPKSNLCALRAGHLDMAIGEYIPAGGLVFDQVMRLNDLNPAGIGSSVFWIIRNEGGDVHELKHQIVRNFERSERINRDD